MTNNQFSDFHVAITFKLPVNKKPGWQTEHASETL